MRDPIWPPPITKNINSQFTSFSSSSFGCLKNVFKKPNYGETIALDLRFIFCRGLIPIRVNPGELWIWQKHHFYCIKLKFYYKCEKIDHLKSKSDPSIFIKNDQHIFLDILVPIWGEFEKKKFWPYGLLKGFYYM